MERDWAPSDEFIDFLLNKKGFKPLLEEESGIVHLTSDPSGMEWRDTISMHRGQSRVNKDTINFYLRKARIPLEEFWGDSSSSSH